MKIRGKGRTRSCKRKRRRRRVRCEKEVVNRMTRNTGKEQDDPYVEEQGDEKKKEKPAGVCR